MQKIITILNNIVKNKAGLIPAYTYDETGIFEKYFEALDKSVFVIRLENDSKVSLQNNFRNLKKAKYSVLYSRFCIDVDSLVATNKVQYVQLTGELLLEFCDEIKHKLSGSILLTSEQTRILVENFDDIIPKLGNQEKITSGDIKAALFRSFKGRNQTPKELLISFIKGEYSVTSIRNLELHEQSFKLINDSFGIDIGSFPNSENLLHKVIITLLLKKHSDFGAEFNDSLLSVSDEKLNKMLDFIKENNANFNEEISSLNKMFKCKFTSDITYLVPKLFENYIAANLSNFCNLDIDRNSLWTEDMTIIADLVEKLGKLDTLLNKYVSYLFSTNAISEIIKEYKDSLYKIDSVYREMCVCYESLSFNLEFYAKLEKSTMLNKLTDMYFNVIANINGKYISGYNSIVSDRENAIRQDEVLRKIKFENDTVFIFADGLRYELAKPFISDICCNDAIDYDVYSTLPTETEIGMNAYFITDERLRINSRNVFELAKQGKVITQIVNWRTEKLAEIVKQAVISFEEFKKFEDYSGSVVYFYNDVDNALHNYNSSRKVTSATMELRQAIQYSVDRGFDVMLLSDHGFIDIGSRIQIQDNEIDSEKKKSRYLILNNVEKVDSMYYKDDIEIADFIEMGNKKICFINSVNSLRQTTKYTHGGISLQETIITAILFKSKRNIDLKSSKFIVNIEAFNELKIETQDAENAECSIYAGEKKIYMCVIDDNEYAIRISIRNYNKGDEFLILIQKGEIIEKRTVKKSGNTVIDKELDIF